MNLLLNHGVRSALEYAASGDLAAAHDVSHPELAPHLEFVDLDGHGYGVVSVDASRMATDFVCIPRPIERAATPDGWPLRVACGIWRGPLRSNYLSHHLATACEASSTLLRIADNGFQ